MKLKSKHMHVGFQKGVLHVGRGHAEFQKRLLLASPEHVGFQKRVLYAGPGHVGFQKRVLHAGPGHSGFKREYCTLVLDAIRLRWLSMNLEATLKAYSHHAKAKIFFDLLRFRSNLRLVWIGPYTYRSSSSMFLHFLNPSYKSLIRSIAQS